MGLWVTPQCDWTAQRRPRCSSQQRHHSRQVQHGMIKSFIWKMALIVASSSDSSRTVTNLMLRTTVLQEMGSALCCLEGTIQQLVVGTLQSDTLVLSRVVNVAGCGHPSWLNSIHTTTLN